MAKDRELEKAKIRGGSKAAEWLLAQRDHEKLSSNNRISALEKFAQKVLASNKNKPKRLAFRGNKRK